MGNEIKNQEFRPGNQVRGIFFFLLRYDQVIGELAGRKGRAPSAASYMTPEPEMGLARSGNKCRGRPDEKIGIGEPERGSVSRRLGGHTQDESVQPGQMRRGVPG